MQLLNIDRGMLLTRNNKFILCMWSNRRDTCWTGTGLFSDSTTIQKHCDGHLQIIVAGFKHMFPYTFTCTWNSRRKRKKKTPFYIQFLEYRIPKTVHFPFKNEWLSPVGVVQWLNPWIKSSLVWFLVRAHAQCRLDPQ